MFIEYLLCQALGWKHGELSTSWSCPMGVSRGGREAAGRGGRGGGKCLGLVVGEERCILGKESLKRHFREVQRQA